MKPEVRIKVAMICHFSNSVVRPHLPLKKRRLYHWARRLMGLAVVDYGHGDMASWDTSLINYFISRDDVELNVISAYTGLKKRIVSFEDSGVHYDFVSCDRSALLKHIFPQPKWWLRFNPMAVDIKRLVRNRDPDLVLLVGLENPYYSSAVLGINEYPIYGLCQTIYNNPERSRYSFVDNINSYIESRIFHEHRYFGVYCKKHYDLLKLIAPDKYIFKFGFPSTGKLLEPTPCEKQYDFVNFALEMSAKKGYTDAIEATALVKKKYPHVKLNLVGGGSAEIKAELQKMAEDLGVHENVFFTPFFEKKSDLFLHIQKSRFALLPCKMDNTSGTMTQAMQLGLPLVVYKTSGTPIYNRDKECALIAEHCNVVDLAEKMLVLMSNPVKAEMLSKNAREFQEKRAEYKRDNGDRLVANLHAIIENYRSGTPIPKEQLFNPERDD